MLLALTRDWNYDDQMQFGVGVMDLRMAATNADGDENSRDPTFFTYIYHPKDTKNIKAKFL